jgi:hypothetical protein
MGSHSANATVIADDANDVDTTATTATTAATGVTGAQISREYEQIM